MTEQLKQKMSDWEMLALIGKRNINSLGELLLEGEKLFVISQEVIINAFGEKHILSGKRFFQPLGKTYGEHLHEADEYIFERVSQDIDNEIISRLNEYIDKKINEVGLSLED